LLGVGEGDNPGEAQDACTTKRKVHKMHREGKVGKTHGAPPEGDFERREGTNSRNGKYSGDGKDGKALRVGRLIGGREPKTGPRWGGWHGSGG